MNFRKTMRSKLISRYGISRTKREQLLYGEQFAYGHRETLLRYAGMDDNLVFKAIISHGDNYPIYENHLQPIYDSGGEEVLQLRWRTDAEFNATLKGIKRVTSIGAIGIYELLNSGHSLSDLKLNLQNFAQMHTWNVSLAGQYEILSNAGSILYLPHHSWEGDVLTHEIPPDSILLKLDTKKVTVCLGALDFTSPSIRRYYAEKGWHVTCAGLRDSIILTSTCGGRVEFLSELLKLIENHDYIVADQITTALFYSAILGKRCGILADVSEPKLEWSSWRDDEKINAFTSLTRESYGWLWGDPVNRREMEEEITTLLGISSIKSQEFFQNNVPTLSLADWKN